MPSWILLNGSTRNYLLEADKNIFLFAVSELRVRSCSSSVLHRRQTQAEDLLSDSSSSVHSMYGTMAGSLELAGSDIVIRNWSDTFATQGLLSTFEVADSSTNMFFNAFLAPSLTVWKIRSSPVVRVVGSMMQWFSMSWCLTFGTKPRRTYYDLRSTKWISCRGY